MVHAHDDADGEGKMAWRGNRRSSFAQEFHASEREKQTERASFLSLKGTIPSSLERQKELTLSKESSPRLAGEDDLVSNFASYVKVRNQGMKQVEDSSEDSESEKEEENVVQCVVSKCHKAVNATLLRPSPVIEKITKLSAIQTYVSCTQDGHLKLWHMDSLKLLRVQENGIGAWISDIAAMAQQPLAAFAMDRSITFYDTGRLSFDVLGRIKNMDNIPMCATWVRTVDSDKLLYGDDSGYLHILNFTDEWGGENPKVALGVVERLLPGMSEEEPWRIHSSWVSRLMYLTHSCSLLSSSMDGQLMMLDIEKQRKKWSAKEHQHGISAFSYGRL